MVLPAAAYGDLSPRVLDGAVLVELIHTASLVHDDVVDNAARRRGMPSAPARLGNTLAVLVGDYLYFDVSWSFEVFFNVDFRIAESLFGFAFCCVESLYQACLVVSDSHSFSSAAGSRRRRRFGWRSGFLHILPLVDTDPRLRQLVGASPLLLARTP